MTMFAPSFLRPAQRIAPSVAPLLSINISICSRPDGAAPTANDDLDDFHWPAACVWQPIDEPPGILATLATRAMKAIETLAVRLGVRRKRVFSRARATIAVLAAPVPGMPTPSAQALRLCPSPVVLRPLPAQMLEDQRGQEEANRRDRHQARVQFLQRREAEEIAKWRRFRPRPDAECPARTTSMRQSCSRLRKRIPSGRTRV